MAQWLSRPGGPRLALADVTRRRKGTTWVVSGTIVQSSPFYEVSLPLRLETEGGSAIQTLAVSEERTSFAFTTTTSPRRLLLDPDAQLFRLLSPAELAPTVNRIKGSEKLLAVIAADCRAREETIRLLLESLGQRGAMVVAEGKVDAASLSGYDLLFCGAPQRIEMLPFLPDGITLARREFVVDRERFEGPDSLLFLVMARSSAPSRVAAIFLPLSEGAAERYQPKITHYGSYGYLVFAGGENRHKGRFPPTGEGNVVEFRERANP
jgi:hypothetical protein